MSHVFATCATAIAPAPTAPANFVNLRKKLRRCGFSGRCSASSINDSGSVGSLFVDASRSRRANRSPQLPPSPRRRLSHRTPRALGANRSPSPRRPRCFVVIEISTVCAYAQQIYPASAGNTSAYALQTGHPTVMGTAAHYIVPSVANASPAADCMRWIRSPRALPAPPPRQPPANRPSRHAAK